MAQASVQAGAGRVRRGQRPESSAGPLPRRRTHPTPPAQRQQPQQARQGRATHRGARGEHAVAEVFIRHGGQLHVGAAGARARRHDVLCEQDGGGGGARGGGCRGHQRARVALQRALRDHHRRLAVLDVPRQAVGLVRGVKGHVEAARLRAWMDGGAGCYEVGEKRGGGAVRLCAKPGLLGWARRAEPRRDAAGAPAARALPGARRAWRPPQPMSGQLGCPQLQENRMGWRRGGGRARALKGRVVKGARGGASGR